MSDTTFAYKDLGMSRITKDLRELGSGAVLVGWPGNGKKHREVVHVRKANGTTSTRKKKTETPMDVARLAIIHEFGSPKNNLPARPVMRQTNQKYGRSIPGVISRLTKEVIAGSRTPGQALARLGVYWEGRIKLMFREGVFRPLKPATIARKGSSKPLIDSGQLRQSVTSVVVRR